MTRFSTLNPDGSETNVRTIPQSALQACRFTILVADHYREDGSCKCDDPEHRRMMIAEWEYNEADFEGIPLRGGQVTNPYEKYLKTGVKTPRERPKGTRMGRGHFKLIAAALRDVKPETWPRERAQWRRICGKMADALAQTNPSFNRKAFLTACGVSDET